MTTMPQRESTIAAPDDARKQLGAFLRARRESLDPQRPGCRALADDARRACGGKRGGDAGGGRRHLVHRWSRGGK